MELLIKGRPQAAERVAVPADALRYVGFSAWALDDGQAWEGDSAGEEWCVVLLSGHVDIAVEHPRQGRFGWERIGERDSVFADLPPYAVFLPPECWVRCRAHGRAEIAICKAPGDPQANLPPRLIEPAAMRRSVRGRDANTRFVCDILPDSEPAHSLLVVEVITPSGHSSSYPPHRHDSDDLPAQSFLEEIYYHRLDPPQGFVFQRVYSDERDLDQALAVENHDVVLVPRGYHPVCVPWGYRSYYLNVMAGPKRVWKFHNDPAHAWLLGG
ncbi:5-deoxy-glucuronate isomerase [Pseudomonas aeruginosa]|uniref:5-deoxy-glucuronate isomerase n=1 Tax=Pseudomonas aeruginosa TaxID=287 RepID=UPI00232D644D|nr:5-deoxy-glucuronate isomerase [Pseudomonas aeruginosa]